MSKHLAAAARRSSTKRSATEADRETDRDRRWRPKSAFPRSGESVTEATIGQWFKKVGDAVAADEPLVELETDKVTIEVPAPAAGVLDEIAAKDGETVGVGALLGADRRRASRCRQAGARSRGGRAGRRRGPGLRPPGSGRSKTAKVAGEPPIERSAPTQHAAGAVGAPS